MSRNLCRTDCHVCGSDVVVTGPAVKPRWGPLTMRGEVIRLADGHCRACKAQYSAWIDPCGEVVDLSYRSTFNDEPGPADIPEGTTVEIIRIIRRFGAEVYRERVEGLM